MSKKQHGPFQEGDDPEWYTPMFVINFVKYVFGGKIDLDPASNHVANRIVGATRYFDKSNDGLAQSWNLPLLTPPRTVFCNAPYGRGNVTGRWWQKMVEEFRLNHFDVGIFLANAKTETAWFQDALETCPILLPTPRIRFWKPGVESDQGHFGSALVLLSRPTDGPPGRLYSEPPTPYIAAGEDSPDPDPALARFLSAGRDLGQVVISI